jgi:hypothetical protein
LGNNDDNSFAIILGDGRETQVPKTAEEYDVSIHELPTFLFLEAEALVLANHRARVFELLRNPGINFASLFCLAGRYGTTTLFLLGS